MFGDLRPASVYYDWANSRVAQEHDVLGEVAPQRIVLHRIATELDDDSATVETLQPRQRFDERCRFRQRFMATGGRRCHVL